MNQEIISSLSMMIVNGSRLDLPSTPISNYAQLKVVLTKAGGKYKKNGFEFGKPANAILDRLLGGEKINDKKDYNMFFTPEAVAKDLVSLANVTPNDSALEPSAGQGAIADQLKKFTNKVATVEIHPDNCKVLAEKGYSPLQEDFLKTTAAFSEGFDVIVANPPFSGNQDIDHIKHMYTLLKSGGRLVSCASRHWEISNNKKESEFREWLCFVDAEVTYLPAGTFKESGTSISTSVIQIVKS